MARVGGEAAWVYSSRAFDFVPDTDAAFIAWGDDGSAPTDIDTDYNLGGVLASYPGRPVPQSVLDGYLDRRLKMLESEPDYSLWMETYRAQSMPETIARIRSKL